MPDEKLPDVEPVLDFRSLDSFLDGIDEFLQGAETHYALLGVGQKPSRDECHEKRQALRQLRAQLRDEREAIRYLERSIVRQVSDHLRAIH